MSSVLTQLQVIESPDNTPTFLPLEKYSGYCTIRENAINWFRLFTILCNHVRFTKLQRIQCIVTYLDGPARDWYFELPSHVRNDYHLFVSSFYENFGPPSVNLFEAEEIWLSYFQNADCV